MSRNLLPKIHIPEIGADFLLIPAGAFYVGEKANRRLAIVSKPFYLQETPVTQRQYQALIGTNPAKFARFEHNPDNPVEQVSWNDAVEFTKKLSQQTGLRFRLPTEIEWEYAASEGNGDKYKYAGSNTIDEVGWYRYNSNRQTHPVKQKKPNGYGLYDMTGNVQEWCSDQYSESYPNQELIDYTGPTSGSRRVLRGGSWEFIAYDARVAFRERSSPDYRLGDFGFRLVLEAP